MFSERIGNLLQNARRQLDLSREELVTIHVTHGSDVVVQGRLEEGITFSVKDASPVVILRIQELTSRLIADYLQRKDEIISL